jgi:hypothetical protein
MTLNLDLPSALDQYLLHKAREQGISIEAMTLQLLTNSISILDSRGYANERKQAEAVNLLQSWLDDEDDEVKNCRLG